jgi:predicted site-specific integrase-resolvase
VDWDDVLDMLTTDPPDAGWVTLEEASNAAGLARSTLRSWYRSGQIPSRMIDAVIDRALRSSRLRRQLEQGRSLAAEVERLNQRVEVMERMLGLR